MDDSGVPHEEHPTTTHDPAHGGAPRLALEQESYLADERQSVWYLRGALIRIGSDPACEVTLPGLAPQHAAIRWDQQDELTITSEGPEVRVHGRVVRAQLLRSGARIEVGEHVLAYYRDEHADHGRPYGGREGGEIGFQRSQPPREQHASGRDGYPGTMSSTPDDADGKRDDHQTGGQVSEVHQLGDGEPIQPDQAVGGSPDEESGEVQEGRQGPNARTGDETDR